MTGAMDYWVVEKKDLQTYIDDNMAKVIDGAISEKLKKFSNEIIEISNRIAMNSIFGKPDYESIQFLELCIDNLFYAYAENEKFRLQYSFKRVVVGTVNQVLTQIMKNAATSLMLYQKI